MNNLLQVARQAVKAVPEVAQYLSEATLAALKGGAGSGNFGHEGRPGLVGGSGGGYRASDTYIQEKNRMIQFSRNNRVETGVLFDQDGNIISRYSGNGNSVSVDTSKLPDNSNFSHTHPSGDGTLSPDDIYCMGVSKCAAFEAIAMNGVIHVIYRTSNSKSPSIQSVRSYYMRTFKKYASQRENLDYFNNAMFYASRDTADHFGYNYEVIK